MTAENPTYWWNSPAWTLVATLAQVIGTSIAAWAAWESRKSANAAKESVELTTQSMGYRDRAYISCTWSEVRGLKRPGDPLTIHLKFKNIGCTPGTSIRQFNAISLHEDTSSLSDLDLLNRLLTSAALGDVGPSGEFDVNFLYEPNGNLFSLTPEAFDDLQRGKWTFHAFGRITYKDVFGAEHETRWSRVYDPRNQSFPNTSHFNSMT
jgi:hypothetical protein